MLPVEPSPDHFRKELYANVFSTRPHAIGCINRDSKCRFLSRYVLFTKKCFKMRRQPLVQIIFCNSGRNGSRMEWCYEMALGRKCILGVHSVCQTVCLLWLWFPTFRICQLHNVRHKVLTASSICLLFSVLKC